MSKPLWKRLLLPALLLVGHGAVLLVVRNAAARSWASNSVILMCVLAAAGYALRAARRDSTSVRYFWQLVASAFFLWAAGQICWMYYDNFLASAVPDGGLDDILYLSWSAPLLLALFVHPSTSEVSVSERALECIQVFIVLAITYVGLFSAVSAGSQAAIDQAALRVYNIQNGALVILFAFLAVTEKSRMRSLFRRMFVFLLAYSTMVGFWNWGSTYINISSGMPYDLLLSFPFCLAAVLAETWTPQPETSSSTSQSSAKSLIVNFSPMVIPMFPLLAFAFGMHMREREYRASLYAITACFLCYAVRFALIHRRQAALLEQVESGQRELRNNAQRYRAITENSSDAILIIDERNEIRFCNPAAESIFGYSAAQIVGKTLMMLMPARYRLVHEHGFAAYLKSNKKNTPWRNLEIMGLRSDAAEVPLEISFSEYEQNGQRFFMATARTLSERKQAEAALRKSEERFRLISRATNDAVWDWDLITNAIWWGEGFQTIFGYAPEDVGTGLESWTGRIHPEDVDRVIGSIKHFIATDGSFWSDDYRFRRKDGTYARTFDRGYLLRDDSGQPVRMIGAMADVTERESLTEQLRQAQKMEAIGQLAGGVAHDVNNVLMVITSYLTLLERQIGSHESAQRYVREVRKAAEKGGAFTSQLLAFSRRQVLLPEALDLSEYVCDQISMLQRLIGEDVELRFEPWHEPMTIKFDRGQLGQVLMNLAVNARDAMPRGGVLSIRTQPTEIRSDFVRSHPWARRGRYVLLKVSDNGSGMSEDVRQRIFEPFFTTKEKGNGTGLGLATVYGIVKQSGAFIDVQSEPGKGTTFDIYIPYCVEETAPVPDRETPVRDLRGEERILLVEDEAGIRCAVSDYLIELGYRITMADDGREGLKIIEREGPFDLLISDVVMPHVGGQELVTHFRHHDPSAATLLISGYNDALLKQRSVVAEGTGFLQKPFTLAELASRVRELLDQQSTDKVGEVSELV